MKVSTIADVRSASDKSVVEQFRGIVTWVGKYFPEDKAKKKQAFQKIEVTSGGDKIAALLRNREEIPATWVDRPIVIMSTQGSRGWTGCLAKDNEYNGEVERVLWITATATVIQATDGNAVGGGGKQEGQAPPAAASSPPARTVAGTQSRTLAEDRRAIVDAMQEIGKAVNATILIGRGVQAALASLEQQGFTIDSELERTLHATYFIRLDKTGKIMALPSGSQVVQFLDERDAARAAGTAGTAAEEAERKRREEAEAEARQAAERARAAERAVETGEDDVPF